MGTILQVKENVAASTGIPWHDQRLLMGMQELNKRGQSVREALGNRSTADVHDVSLVVRKYERREMLAAWIIEGIWKRHRSTPADIIRNEAAQRIATFWRNRRVQVEAA